MMPVIVDYSSNIKSQVLSAMATGKNHDSMVTTLLAKMLPIE